MPVDMTPVNQALSKGSMTGRLVAHIDKLKRLAAETAGVPRLKTMVDDWYWLPDTVGGLSTPGVALYARFSKARWVLSTLPGSEDVSVCTLERIPFCEACRTEFPNRGWVGQRCPRCDSYYVAEVSADWLMRRIKATGLTSVCPNEPQVVPANVAVLDFEEV